MASRVFLTFGDRTIMVSRPATYEDLVSEIRLHFPDVSAVYSLVVVFQPATVGGLLENWVQVAPSAYSHVHDGAELFVNVVHPLTKEYILPLPGQPVPNRQRRKQIRRTDGQGNLVGDEGGVYDATAQDDQVSKTRPRGISSGPREVSHKFYDSSVSLELERPGGDAFVSGWGGASERFRRSTRLVPNLKDCKEAVGQTVGQSKFYPDDEEEEIADIKFGTYQNQYQDQGLQATEAGWYTGAEPTQRDENPGHTEAQHLAGGLEEDQRQVAGSGDQPEDGHLTNGIHTNGVTNGNSANGHPAAHSEVSQYPQHQVQHYGASDWSPLRQQSTGYYRPQDFRSRSYAPGEPVSKAFAGPRPRRDPAEVTYGSPRPRIQGSNSGWTTIGRKKNTWTNIPLQEEGDPERAQPNVENNDHAWYAQTPPPNNFHRTASHGEYPGHRDGVFERNNTDRFQQKQRSGPEMSWGADFWGGPPPNRTQRGAFTHHDTPASDHWQ